MAPKKKTGFIVFVNEWRRSNPEGGKMSFQESIERCGGVWEKMSTLQKKSYNDYAKNSNTNARRPEPLNSFGETISSVHQKISDEKKTTMDMKHFIERIVRYGSAQNDLEHTKFVFAAFNYFAKKDNIYQPAEFSACLFSLKSGKINMFTSHINPGDIIFGLSSVSQTHSKETHMLPVPPNALGESNIGNLYKNILEYLRECDATRNGDSLVVFTSTEMIPIVKGCFRYLACGDTDILVYDIQYLLYILKKGVMEIAGIPHAHVDKHMTDTTFLNDFFMYAADIACQFHEDNERFKYCTQSMVSRWCYMFCDSMCDDLAIKPLPGKHMPPKVAVNYTVINELPEASNKSFDSFYSTKTEVKQERDSRYGPST